nr:DUF6163 family protein [Mesorhizobium shangrilense]
MAERRRTLHPTAAETAFIWFQRVMAGYCLLFGVLYWIRLVGVYPGELWRFDLMPLHWQVAAVTLAVLFPFAAIGLWMLSSWGPVIWIICAAAEMIMYLGFPNIFGFKPTIGISHLGVVTLYLVFRAVIYFQSRREH